MNAHSHEPAAREGLPIREAIIAATEQIVRDCGVVRVTTRRIASAAGCSEGAIYRHFASKEELLAIAVGTRLSAFPRHALALPERAGSGDVRANLRELAQLAIAFFQNMAPMIVAMIGDAPEMRQRAREIDAQGHGPRWVLRGIADYLRRERDLGRVRADADVDGSALCLLGACLQQALVAHAWGPDLLPFDDRGAAEAIADAVVRGLEPSDAQSSRATAGRGAEEDG